MGLITPPGMEDYRGFFRMLMLIIVGIIVYKNFTDVPERSGDNPAATQTALEEATPPGTVTSDSAIDPKALNSLVGDTQNAVQNYAPSLKQSPFRIGTSEDKQDVPTLFPGLNSWANDKITGLAGTSEGKILINALAQIAMEKKAGVKDLTLFVAKATGKADYRDIVVGTGARVHCGVKSTMHLQITNSNRGAALDTEAINSPVGVRLGDNSVIPGIEQLTVGMRVGGKRIIGIPSELAYDHPDFHNSLIAKGEPVFATVTMISAEKIPRAAVDTVSDMPRITQEEDNSLIFCGMPAKAFFYRGKDMKFPQDGVASPAFVLGQASDGAPPLELHAMLHKSLNGIADTYTAVENSTTAAYINKMLYPDNPQAKPVFTVVVQNAPATRDDDDTYDFLEKIEFPEDGELEVFQPQQ